MKPHLRPRVSAALTCALGAVVLRVFIVATNATLNTLTRGSWT